MRQLGFTLSLFTVLCTGCYTATQNFSTSYHKSEASQGKIIEDITEAHAEGQIGSRSARGLYTDSEDLHRMAASLCMHKLEYEEVDREKTPDQFERRCITIDGWRYWYICDPNEPLIKGVKQWKWNDYEF